MLNCYRNEASATLQCYYYVAMLLLCYYDATILPTQCSYDATMLLHTTILIVQRERRGRLPFRGLELLRPQKLLPRGLGAEPASTGVEHPRLEEPDHGGDSGVDILGAGAH